MKPASFQYHAPTSIDEAVAVLDEVADDGKALAGGQSLVPILALRLSRFGHLVDLNRVPELAFVTSSPGTVSVGAMTRQTVAGASGVLAREVPLLARAIPLIGHFQIRNRGTVGGSIAHADPASELPAVALCLDAELEVVSTAGTRRVPARDFFVSTWETALAPGDLVVAVHFPARRASMGFAIEELAWRLGDFAIAGCAAAVELGGDGRIKSASVALMGMGPTPLRAPEAEAAMIGEVADELDLGEVGAAAVAPTDPTDDVHASGAYRKRVAAGLVTRALSSAIEEARDG